MMQAARTELTGSGQTPAPDDPYGNSDLDQMMTLSGSALDGAFLDNMISHHASAVTLSHRALPNLSRADLRALADKTIVDQTREMNEMLDMRERD